MSVRLFLVLLVAALAIPVSVAETYYVSKAGNDSNDGSLESPLKTINASAQIAHPGDTIIVHQGVYREWVDPVRGGTSDSDRIIYQAAEGETVIIAGSELVAGWQEEDGKWRIDIPEASFGPFNPYNEGIRHPDYITVDEAGDGWGWLKYGRWAHRGDVIYRGTGLTEQEHLTGVATPQTWYTETADGQTVIWANFGDEDPNDHGVELSRRPYGFYPSRSGLNYITVRGFVVANIATHWAPPTAHQPGAIGPNGGHHWVIENNTIIHSRTLAISIGIPTGAANNEKSGSHLVTDNILLRNGQAGIAGQTWNHDTIISRNWIEDTNYRKEFGGWETAAIKIHNADNVQITDNVIRNVSTSDPAIGAAHGIWVDYENTNTRVSRNVIAGADAASILTEANWNGPTLIDHNIVFGGEFGTYSSRGDLWVNNLFVDAIGRWENQDWNDRIPVSHSRWIRNIFVGNGLDGLPPATPETEVLENVYLLGARPSTLDQGVQLAAPITAFQLDWSDGFTGSLSIEKEQPATHLDAESYTPITSAHASLTPFSSGWQSASFNSVPLSQDFTGRERGVSDFPFGVTANALTDNTLGFGLKGSEARAAGIKVLLEQGIAAIE